MAFTQKNANVRIKCLATRGSELWACSDISSGFTLGESLDDGATFTPKIKYVTSLCGPVECQPKSGGTLGCGADSNASSCVAPYETFCSLTDVSHSCGTCPGSDAGGSSGGGSSGGSGSSGGTGDAGSPRDGGAGGNPSSSSSCGCSVVGGGGATGLAAGLALAALALLRRRDSQR